MNLKPVTIRNIISDSIAEEIGIEAGDIILSINGEKVKDIFDYKFLITNEELLLEIKKPSGEVWEFEIEKEEYEDLGIEFDTLMIDETTRCNNKCIFCFIDQLPPKLRKTLYFKDDDSRLSFFMGNYVTLTNINNRDIDRIIKYKMTPINVSVHTTDPELRVFMLKNKTAGNLLEKIKRLINGGITVNCQIVLLRKVNDGDFLNKTIKDLCSFYPAINSISVVPVGITKYRKHLYELMPFDEKSSLEVISTITKLQSEFIKKFNSRIVYLADEFFIMANMPIPDALYYEDFPQIENGVGLIAMFISEFEEFFKENKIKMTKKRKVSIATGVSAYKYIKYLSCKLEEMYNNLRINVYCISNDFFGENITVTGLLTGQDILKQLKAKDLGEEILICKSMLKFGENVFLDDITVDTLEANLGVKITVVENNGADFIKKIIGF